jgi:hypothetical protein
MFEQFYQEQLPSCASEKILFHCYFTIVSHNSSSKIFELNNMGFFHSTSQIHGFNTIRNFDLYRPQTNLSICQRGPYYFGIKLFNHLPLDIKELSYNAKQLRSALRAFLYSKSFYTLDEYFNEG